MRTESAMTDDPRSLADAALLDALSALVARSNAAEADLLEHLAEVDRRGLHRDRAHPSLFSFCVGELGFSESAAYNRIGVARASTRATVWGQRHGHDSRRNATFLRHLARRGALGRMGTHGERAGHGGAGAAAQGNLDGTAA
jgi:hypothetical protein